MWCLLSPLLRFLLRIFHLVYGLQLCKYILKGEATRGTYQQRQIQKVVNHSPTRNQKQMQRVITVAQKEKKTTRAAKARKNKMRRKMASIANLLLVYICLLLSHTEWNTLSSEDDEDEKLCKICMDADINICFVPCGHLAGKSEFPVLLALKYLMISYCFSRTILYRH